jgi:hypothetical protein
VFQALEQVIEGIPLFEPSKNPGVSVSVVSVIFSVFDFVQIAHARQTSSKLGLYSLKRDFQFVL